MHKLIIEDDEGKTTIVPLIRDEITIGRKEGNTIRLTERNISRRHARLTKANGQVFLEDLGSYNGIKVNGTKIKGRVPLQEGDRVQIGDYLLALKMHAAGVRKADPFEEMKTIPLERAQVAETSDSERPTIPGGPQGQEAAKAAQQAVQAVEQATGAPAPASQPPLEAQPTRQIHSDQIEGTPAKEAAGRLVVVSQNLGGTEFVLDKQSMVIGRIPENDMVVEHRSISRHHAKVVREGQNYFIVDLESQNGVIVNGERYDRVQLRKGDLIDLGHVRLRFVAPGEHYVFSEDSAQMARPGRGRGSRKGIYLAAAGLVGLAALAIVLLWPKPKKKEAEKKPGEKVTTPEPAPEPDPGEQPRVVSLDRSKINAAIAARDWKKAEEEADAFLKAHPGDAQALKLKRKAQEERQNKKRYDTLMKAWRRGNVKAAMDACRNFPERSDYYVEVKRLCPQVLKRYADELYGKAQTLARRKRCGQVRALAEKMAAVVPSDRRFKYLADRCGKTHVAVDDPGRRPRTRGEPRTRPTTRPTTRPSTGPSAAQLAAQTRTAWVNNNCSKAIRVGRKAYRAKSSSRIAMMVGTCACRIRRKSTAKWAYRKLSGGFKSMVARACRAKGITLP